MVHILALFVIITLSMFIVRAGGLALNRTGLSRESAMFQSQSAFMGVGFTTTEAETVVTHPVRRRIIRVLMLLGFVSVTSTVSTLVVTFAQPHTVDPWIKIVTLAVGVVGLWSADRVPFVQRLIDRVVTKALETMTTLEVVDYEEILNLHKGYAVAHVILEEDSWLADRTLRDLRLADEGLLVLSIERASGATIATPGADTQLHVGDGLLCYGRNDVLTNIGARLSGNLGDRSHDLAVRKHRLVQVEERVEDREQEEAAGAAPDAAPHAAPGAGSSAPASDD